ncbi:TPA: hypothetical protein N0F65_002694 [Lagenidium giganteum]|uniref:protein-serine/threonine phosphatase n=1 Tax=Lagenidium giganteum TaxID=4803 RepID=A0AAV2Z2B3_9STRA|nr:TPA: hypothetical protein N0F65_002694 [Lagenidium giganteum]
MIPATRNKAPATSTSAKPELSRTGTGGLFQTVVFSRKNTSHGPDDVGRQSTRGSPTKKQLAELHPNPLASIVHQADRNGKQQALTTGRSVSSRRLTREDTENLNGGSFRNLFANIWSALGISEQQQQAQAQKNSTTKPGTAPAGKPNASRNVVELRKSVIPPLAPQDAGKKCLVLDLDETLVHSSFKPTQNPDYIIPVDIDGTIHQVYVCKRPGVEDFLREMGKIYEIVIYTASLSKYADPLLDRLDPDNVIRHRLFREHCVQYEGNYVKDLSLLDRDITQTIIIDNSPMSYLFHPRNAIGCSSFIDDMNDRELESIARFLTHVRSVEDVRNHLHTWDASY